MRNAEFGSQRISPCQLGDCGGHEQLISNGKRFKPAFSKRDKKQTMIDLKGILTNWVKN
jgi:hypothetical protein